jgi:two-component system, cell cycle sensor histidine kinase and response regulator CckA
MTRVLIVDDKEENVYYLQALLAGHGFEVETARHGAEALVKARHHPPELIVSDLLMPVMDGYTLLRHWKSDAQLREIPFIVYTATYTEEQDEKLAISLGADAFILKPAEPEDFLARIRAVQAASTVAQPVTHYDATGAEQDTLKIYSETLIRKLEEKTLQLEQSNQALQQDIAERTRMEESLRESEERFRATFEQVAVGIAHVDLGGRFLRVNDKLCAITGYTREELLKLTFIEMTVPEERAESDKARLDMLAGLRADYLTEKRYLRKNGESYWINVVTTLLRDSAGEPKYFISVIADITARKQLEQQFLRAQRMESIGTLAGGIAHDLNNLLAPIMMGVELLRFGDLDAKTAQMVENMERSAKRAASLVRQVLSFARGVEGVRAPIQIGHIMQEVGSIIESTFPKNITLLLSHAADLWPVVSDPTQLNQVMLNLCVNARDAMANGGCLTLRATNVVLDGSYAALNQGVVPGSYVVIEVTDTGCGIPKEIVDRIFDPFFTTKEPGKGTGLGLSTVMGIVRSHGGFVHVHSQPGKGTTFKVHLPAYLDVNTGDSATRATERLPMGGGELVMVVDDESSIVDITRQMLESFGYRVITAGDGAQAIGLYARQSEEVAVVITDMMMPTMDGPMLMAALRRIHPGVKIIAVSGLSANSHTNGGTGSEADYFLTKPYTAEDLLVLLRKALTGKP